jgi:hypothetical protein
VWCQGGQADGARYQTLVEPPEEIAMWFDPIGEHGWLRILVSSRWPDSFVYVRQRDAEQFDHERIYYPQGEQT